MTDQFADADKMVQAGPDLQTFNFETLPIRVVLVNGEPWFVAADLALILGYTSTKDATRVLDEDEKGGHILPTPGGAQEFTIVSESGLYTLALRSRREEAKPFRKWVTGEVLPTIRRTGSYGLPAQPALPQSLPEALRLAADLAEERDHLRAQAQALAPKGRAYDSLMSAEGTYSVGEAAKMLKTGELRLFTLLRERKILMDGAVSGWERHNVPYQRFLDAGYFRVITRARPSSEGEKVSLTTRVTSRGLEWLRKGMENLQLAAVSP